MISVKNVVKTYPGPLVALNDVSFEIAKGEICGYIGTNGAGKSTTVKILTGVLSFDKGSAEVNGIDVNKHPIEVKKITGYVPESANLFNSLTVTEYLQFIGTMYDMPDDVISKRINNFSDLFDYTQHLKDSIGNLSKGNKQKILITSALIHNPEVLFFDEPLNGLDANAIFVFQEMVRRLAEKGKTIFYCSHLLDTIEKISTKIILLDKGKIVLDKRTDELKSSVDYTGLEDIFRSLKDETQIKKFVYEEIFG